MTIKIKALARKNPQDITAPPKYYATKVNQGEISLKKLSATIAQMSTVSKTDVYAVLMAFTEIIPPSLEEGKIVRLGDLGSFHISLKSTVSDSAEEVSASNVERLKLMFRPSFELKNQVEGFAVSKI